MKKTGGGDGWADVWMKGCFGWEYKRKHKDLNEAYRQLLLYREDLENPPLLVVCDMDRFEVHTNFTNTAKEVHLFDLAGLAEFANREVLRKLFEEPETLRPGITSEKITVEAAERFAKLADALNQRGIEPLRAAHFLMKLMFCMFGEDTGLLPRDLFANLLESAQANPAILPRRLASLFKATPATPSAASTAAEFHLQFVGHCLQLLQRERAATPAPRQQTRRGVPVGFGPT